MSRSMVRSLALALVASAVVAQSPRASAHWCHDLWGSSYNIVVRPEADSLQVPTSGSTTLVVRAENNMGYPLINFNLSAQASGYTIDISRAAPKVANYLMPGERLRHTLTIARAGGSGSLVATDIEFFVGFGEGTQDVWYPYASGRAVMLKLDSGALSPPPRAPSLGEAHFQSWHLGLAQEADYGTASTGLDDLLQWYCAGRGSWATGGDPIEATYCPGPTTTTCPSTCTRGHNKYDYQHLWGAEFLAVRKGAMSAAQRAELRERLACGVDDSHTTFRFFALILLGYLGEDATARSFLEGRISGGSVDEQLVAKAALLLFGAAADRTAHHAAVTAGLTHGNPLVEGACAAALAILDGNDAAVEAELLPRARWIEPDTSDNGRAFYAAHLLDLVAWSRRGYAALAADLGSVSFYEGPTDAVAPAAPVGVTSQPGSGGTARIDWVQVTQDIGGGNETISQYRVYWGGTARPGAATRPGESGFDYDHTQSTTGIYLNLSGLTEGTTTYVAVIAVDGAQNSSVYSAEVSCAVPITPHAPVAALSCTPASGDAPLDVTCDATASTDANGAGDIASYLFSLDGAAEVAETDGIRALADLPAGNHSVQVRVLDQGGLDDTATQQIAVTDPGSQNHAPTAALVATPTTGYAPLAVAFDATGSADPDGDALSYAWAFGDGTANGSGVTTSHTFTAAGGYTVTLTVTDDGSPSLSGTATVRISATTADNAAPVLDSASVTPLWGPAPLQVRFDASGVYDPDGDALTLGWAFGDGSAPSSTAQAQHTYVVNGQYQVVLTVEDDGTPALGPQTRSFSIAVTDNTPPDATNAAVAPLGGPVPLTVALDAAGCGDPDGDHLTYFWDIALDIVTSQTFDTARAAYTFDQPGSYEITLTLTDDGAPPLEVTRTFVVQAQAAAVPGRAVVGQGCACSQGAVAGPTALAALLLGALAWRRRRPRISF